MHTTILSDAERTVRLAVAMAAADLRCPLPWLTRVHLTRVLTEDRRLDLGAWQQWGIVVLAWLWETRPTLAREVYAAVQDWRNEEDPCPILRP